MHGDLANTGPMTRTALDNALMMNVIARPDPRDPFALADDGVDYVEALATDMRGLKVGVMARLADHPLDGEVEMLFKAAAGRFEGMGCHVEEVTAPFDNDEAGRVWSIHWLSALQRLLQVYPEARHGEFDPGLLAGAQAGARYSLQELVDAQVIRRDLSSAWNLMFERYDLILTPTLAVLPFPVGQNLPDGPDGKPNPYWANTAIFNLTRHPAASVPCGVSRDGLPVGLQIAAGHYRDGLVLAAAAALASDDPRPFPVLPAS